MGFLVSEAESLSIAHRIDPRNLASKKILITGGSGMVGAYLAEAICGLLLQHGLPLGELTVTSKSGDFHNNEGIADLKSVHFVTSGLGTTMTGEHQYVVHAASPASPTHFESARELQQVNGGSVKALISPETEKFLFVSVGEVYGSNAPFMVREDFRGSIDQSLTRAAYPMAKMEAEKIAKAVCEERGVQLHVMRLFHTFGPGVRENDGRSFADFLWRGARGQRPLLRSSGADVRTFLYSQDTSVALLSLLAQEENVGPVNVGSEIPISIVEFAKLVSSAAGLDGEVEYNLSKDRYVHSPNPEFVPSTALLQSIGWHQEVELQDAIIRTLDWIKREIYRVESR